MKRLSIALCLFMLLAGRVLADGNWVCPNCGKENAFNFCGDCGTAKPDDTWICTNCGTENKKAFCVECGQKKPDGSSPASNNLAINGMTPEEMVEKAEEYIEQGNFSKAVELYEIAADQGNRSAIASLMVMYYNGEKIEQDYATAFKWAKVGAEMDMDLATALLARMYQYGQGTDENHAESIKWNKKMADQGDTSAMRTIGLLYYEDHDYTSAVQWFKKAANLGDALAMYCMGYCYEKGEGVDQNYLESMFWYKKSVDNGRAESEEAYQRVNELAK